MPDFPSYPPRSAAATATPSAGTEVSEAFAGLQGRATQVLNAIDDGIFFLDRNGLTIFVNEASVRILGYTVREALGRSMHELTHHHYADGSVFPAEECPILSSVTDAVQQRVGGDIFWNKSGQPVPVDYTSIPIKDGRQVTGVVVTFRDISEHQRAEAQSVRLDREREARTEAERTREALRASENRYRFLAEAIPVQIWTATPDGRLDYVTQRVADYFGVTPERVLGEGWQHVIHPDDLAHAVERWTHSLRTGEPYEVEFRLRGADGRYRWHIARALPQRDEAGRVVHWFGTNTDIDELKELRSRLE
ncbi:MAG TPA: PAS domain S-box protein [Gemmatimonadaceae bacterium]|nr:PAS domain S-box protein [Gemmatimonadaceae bacterium]